MFLVLPLRHGKINIARIISSRKSHGFRQFLHDRHYRIGSHFAACKRDCHLITGLITCHILCIIITQNRVKQYILSCLELIEVDSSSDRLKLLQQHSIQPIRTCPHLTGITISTLSPNFLKGIPLLLRGKKTDMGSACSARRLHSGKSPTPCYLLPCDPFIGGGI